jgi:hypothetical protein
MQGTMSAACPNCGWRQDCKGTGEALAAANTHNASCRELRRRLGSEAHLQPALRRNRDASE